MGCGERVYGCLCDYGYNGHDCSKKRCAVGDDPLTTTGNLDEIQVLECTCGGTCSGSFYLKFENQETSAIAFDASAAIVEAR